ncbi:MAG: M28 family peptidase [Bacteroidales bacterium]|nr:M28 family peptidase [Bacteroidales bacterium]
MTKLTKIFVFFALLCTLPLGAQRPGIRISTVNGEAVLDQGNLEYSVNWLSHEETGGRKTGTTGSHRVAGWIGEHFRSMGLKPLDGTYYHGFKTSAGSFARNVMGMIPGSREGELVVVMAHYDNLGMLDGTFYPGADSNASGVAALIEIGRMFARMKECGKSYSSTLLLVATDAKEHDMAGARALESWLSRKELTPTLVVNLDQLGCTLSPLHPDRPDYLMMLSEPTSGRRSSLISANEGLGLDLGFDYYGSQDFTRLFYRRICEQAVFLEKGIPAVMFTSGITLNNNKPRDKADTLDYRVLTLRVRLIFRYLAKIL